MRIGRWLHEERKSRGLIKFLSERLEVTPQTLRNWRQMYELQRRSRIGRPRYTDEQVLTAKELIRKEMEHQCYPGWRPISKALPSLPVRLVQSVVAEIKLARRVSVRKKVAVHRKQTQVLAREAIWCLDGARVGNKENQVIKDRGSFAYRALREGPPAKEQDVISLLAAVPQLPLVLSTDNAGIYCGRRTSRWLEENKVIHLRSLPRTPQHNGSVEVAIRTLKESKDTSSLYETALSLNGNRLYASKGYKTSTMLDAEMPVAYDVVSRDEFYEKCGGRLRELEAQPMKWRARRMKEREVIYETLEEYGLIKQTGGGGSTECGNAKIFL